MSPQKEMVDTATEPCADAHSPIPNRSLFNRTHWSVVLAAAQGESSTTSAAREEVCRNYWFPLYAYVRRRGYGPEDAKDLTQEFFARLLANHGLATVSPRKGKFRSFLLASMNHLLCDEHDRLTRVKRGGEHPLVSFDAQSAEERYRLEPADQLTADRIFERRYAIALLEQVLSRLEEEYSKSGKGRVFAVLRQFLTGDPAEHDYPAAAYRLKMTEGAGRVAAHRLRRRYGALFREAVAATLDDPEELDSEMRHVLAVLGG